MSHSLNRSLNRAPSDNDTLLNTTPVEISFLLSQPEAPGILGAAFADQPATLSLLREYSFITVGIDYHFKEITRHRTERRAIFEALMTSELFQETLYPHLTTFRDIRDAETLPSYDSPSPPSSPLSHAVESSQPPSNMDDGTIQTPPPNSPLTVEIHSSNSPTNTISLDRESSTASFHTANTHTANEPIGSQSNPIDVDLIPTQLANFDSGLRRSRSDPSSLLICRTCTRNGHRRETCLWDGAIVCPYCMEVGHGRKNCPAIRHDMSYYDPTRNFCMLCGQPGHTLVQCRSLQYPQ